MDTPLFQTEFGHTIDLHDGFIESIERKVEGESTSFIWTIWLFQSPANDPEIERGYRYVLQFVNCRGEDHLTFERTEIYRFNLIPIEIGFAVVLVLLPSGLDFAFVCENMIEVSLIRWDTPPEKAW